MADNVFDFARFFLRLSPSQRKQILANITAKQCEIIRQSSYNLFFNTSIDLSESDRKYLKRHSAGLKKLASRRLCVSDKCHILTRKTRVITRIMEIVVSYIGRERASVSS